MCTQRTKFEFSEIQGIRPACTDSFVSEGNVIVLHGAYQQGTYTDKNQVILLMVQLY